MAYAIGQSVAGRVVDRLGTRRGLSLAVVWYSVAAMATSLAVGFRSFCALRFALGLGEAAGQHRDAAAAVPFEFIDATSLIGPTERLRERVGRYADAGVTTLGVSPFALTVEERLDTLRVMSEIVPSAAEEVPAP